MFDVMFLYHSGRVTCSRVPVTTKFHVSLINAFFFNSRLGSAYLEQRWCSG